MPTFSVNNVLNIAITHYNIDSYISNMRCIYKVLFTRVHPEAEKVNTLGKCSPFSLYSSLIFQSLIVLWVLSKLIPIFTSLLPSA